MTAEEYKLLSRERIDAIAANLRVRIKTCTDQLEFHICEMDDKDILKLYDKIKALREMMNDVELNWTTY